MKITVDGGMPNVPTLNAKAKPKASPAQKLGAKPHKSKAPKAPKPKKSRPIQGEALSLKYVAGVLVASFGSFGIFFTVARLLGVGT